MMSAKRAAPTHGESAILVSLNRRRNGVEPITPPALETVTEYVARSAPLTGRNCSSLVVAPGSTTPLRNHLKASGGEPPDTFNRKLTLSPIAANTSDGQP